jgi:HAD superfamily hydrolase (TIGR01509 family)
MRERAFRALLLDLDGTIADTHHLIHHCLDYTLNAHIGRGMERSVWNQWVGVPLRDLFPVAYAHHGLAAPDSDTVGSLTKCYRTRLAEVDADVQLFPGMSDTLTTLRAMGVRLAVVTTKHGGAASRTLANLGIATLFNAVVAGDDCAHYKPHPEPFVRACELLGLGPDECAAVGDTTADILGAKAAGVHAIAAMWGVVDEVKVMAAGPDRVAQHPCDLVEVLQFRRTDQTG